MTKLEELIKELCPEGVEYVSVGALIKRKSVFTITPSLKVKRNDYAKRGITPIISQENEFISGYCDIIDMHIPVDNYVCFGDHSEHIKYIDFSFVQGADGLKIMSCNETTLIARYFFHAVSSFYKRHNNYERHFKYLIETSLPVPPLPAQREIVRILDNFTELTAELTTELTARKKQYEYYRAAILKSSRQTEIKELGDVCNFVRGPFGGSLKKEIFTTSGYAVYEQQHAIYSKFEFRYFVDEGKFEKMKRFAVSPGDLIVSCSGTMGKIAIIPNNAPIGIINQALLKLTPKSNINNKYLKYCFEDSISQQMNEYARGGAIKNVASVAELKAIKIQVPPIEEQKRIVVILDRFDTLCNDLTSGLPAEIEARQKQYEYYRDKLLSFKEKTS